MDNTDTNQTDLPTPLQSNQFLITQLAHYRQREQVAADAFHAMERRLEAETARAETAESLVTRKDEALKSAIDERERDERGDPDRVLTDSGRAKVGAGLKAALALTPASMGKSVEARIACAVREQQELHAQEVGQLHKENAELRSFKSGVIARDNVGMSRAEYHKAKKALVENESMADKLKATELLCAELKKAGQLALTELNETLEDCCGSEPGEGNHIEPSEERLMKAIASLSSALAKTPTHMTSELARLRAIGEPCSLVEAAGKPKDSLSLIHQYDANACCVLMESLRQQLADMEVKERTAFFERQDALQSLEVVKQQLAERDSELAKAHESRVYHAKESDALRVHVAELEHDRNVTASAMELLSGDVKEAQGRMEKAETQRDALIARLATLSEIGKRLLTQNNRSTENPMFCVQTKRRDVVPEGFSCESVWVVDGEEVEEGTADAEEYYIRERWETVMVAFTEGGCNEYLRQNGHNLKEPRIYVESFNRCPEMIAIRAWLMDAAVNGAPVPPARSRCLDSLEFIPHDGAAIDEARKQASTKECAR